MTFHFTIVSKDDEFCLPKESINGFLQKHPGSSITKYANNKEKITILYNKEIESSIKSGYDFSVMMHADVNVDLDSMVSHIEKCSGKYDVMGLCGCEKISVSESPLNWFCGSSKFPHGRWGCVTHGELNNSTSFFNFDRKNVTDHQVSCIDGLCIILSKKSMESGLRFDENLSFNCYDTQISFDSIINFKLRLGVIVEPSLIHFSVGRSILQDSFLDEEIILRKRFGFDVPKGSRLESRILNGEISV